MSMSEKWKKAVDNCSSVGVVFIDFQKAFDTVPHDILSYNLRAIGIPVSLHEWLMSFLSNRRMFSEVNNYRSVTNFVR